MAYYKRPEFNDRLADTMAANARLARQDAMTKARAAEQRQARAQQMMEQAEQMRSQIDQTPPGAERSAMQQDYLANYSQAKIAGYNAGQMHKQVQEAETRYNQSADRYNRFIADQQAEYNRWRKSIRQPNIVHAELDSVSQRLQELSSRRDGLQNINMRMAANAGYTGSVAIWNDSASTQKQIDDNMAQLKQINRQIAQLTKSKALLDEEAGWGDYFRYADLSDAPDFRQESKYQTTATGRPAKIAADGKTVIDTGFEDYIYDFINKNPDAEDVQALKASSEWDWNYLQQMSDEEIATFNYLYKTKGKKEAYEYINYLEKDLTRRERSEQEAHWRKYASESPGKASVFSVLTSPLKGLSYADQAVQMATKGSVDQNTSGNRYSYINNAIRGQVAKQLESGKWGKVGSFTYMTGMSMADFLLNTALGGGNTKLPLAIMGTGAAADATIGAKDRGLDDRQAFTLGTIAGLAEIVTEKVSIDTLLNPDMLKDGTLKYIIKNTLAEGSEEAASDLINMYADIFIAQDESEWKKSIAAYKRQGMNELDAFSQAVEDQAKEMFADFAGGAISGGLMSSVNAGGHKLFDHKPRSLEQIKRDAESSMNPLETKVMPTVDDEIKMQKIQNSQTTAEATGYLYDVKEDIIQQVNRLSKVIGKEINFYQADATESGMENGFYDSNADTIYINVNSQNPTAQIIGHELTHSTEIADVYESLSNLVMERIQRTGGDLETMRKKTARLYDANGHKLNDAEVDQEIVAMYVEKHLLTDEKAIMDMANRNRTVVQAIKEWFDRLLAKLGNKKAQEREFITNARDIYAKALQQADSMREASSLEQDKQTAYAEGNEAYGDALFDSQWNQPGYVEGLLDKTYSISKTEDNRPVAVVDNDILAEIDVDNWNEEIAKQAKKIASSVLAEKAGTIWVNGKPYQINRTSRREFTRSADTERLRIKDKNAFADKMRAANNIEDVIAATTNPKTDGGLKHPRKDDFVDFIHGDVLIQAGTNQYKANTVIGITENGEQILYDVVKIQPTNFNKKEESPKAAAIGNNATSVINEDSSSDSISEENIPVNPKSSISPVEKSDFDDSTEKNSAVRNSATTGKKQYSLRDIDIDRVFIEYGNVAEENKKIDNVALNMLERGKVVSISGDDVESYDVFGKFEDRKSARKYLKKILESFMGKSVYFNHNGQYTEAYLTREGVNHSVGGIINAERNAIFSKYNKLIKNAEYAFSSKNDRHSNANKRIQGEIDWDCFVSTAMIDGEICPVVFKIRTIDTDLRSQIYQIATKKIDGSHDPGQHNKMLYGMSDYGVVPSTSDSSLAQVKSDVKPKFSVSAADEADFDDAAQEMGKKRSTATEKHRTEQTSTITQEELQKIQSIGRKSIFDFDKSDMLKTTPLANRYWKEMGVKSPFFRAWFGDWRANDHTLIEIADKQGNSRGVVKNRDTGWNIQVSGKVFSESNHKALKNQLALNYLPYINDIVKKAVLLDSYGMGKLKSNNSILMHSLYSVADIGNGPELLKLFVEEMNDPNRINTVKRAYQLQNIEKASAVDGGVQRKSPSSHANTANAISSVADLFDAVKVKDHDFHPVSGSVIVNEDGTPRIVYHGTNQNFHVFESDSNEYWFSQSEDYAEAMMEERGGDEVKQVYLNMKKPFYAKLKPDQFSDPTFERPIIRKARAGDYDGVIIENDTEDEYAADTFYVVFNPNQIKSATDNMGTFDKHNKDIRYSIGKGKPADDGKLHIELPKVDDGAIDLSKRLPVKAADYVARTQRTLLAKISDTMSVPHKAGRETLMPVIRKITNEYLQKGTISEEVRNDLFEEAYAAGVEVDTEFYDQYKEVKDHLRTTAVTLSEQDQADIADYNDFRKRAFGTLRIVKKDGIPVDSFWEHLHDMAPNLFPENITHPADQLQHMYDVGKSIQKTEKTLDEYYGPEAEMYKKFARNEFDAALSDAIIQMRDVARYMEDHIKLDAVEPEMTQEEVTALYPLLKETRRAYEKASAKNLLTEEDQKQASRLLRGDIRPEHLNQEKDNVKGILAVYEAKAEYEKVSKQIRNWNRVQKAKRMEEADQITKTANLWKDKSKVIQYQRETMERNVQDIIKDKTVAKKVIDTYFKPVHEAQATATRMKNRYRSQIQDLNISRKVEPGNKVSEAYAVQLIGEATDNIQMMQNSKGRIKYRDGKSLDDWKGTVQDLWKENPNLDKQKIYDAVDQFRKIYDDLFQQMNEVRIRNGYEPVNYRHGYFPHFQAEGRDGVMALFGKALGIDTEVTALPTTINGLTHTFKPGIRWFGNALERQGFETTYDAVEGFDKYIEGVADVIHYTDNIQKLRALASQIRYRTSEPGIQKQVDEVRAREDLSDTDKELRIKEIYEKGKFELSNFVVELDEYTNLLANKKSRDDRNMEQKIGRNAYNVVKSLESRVAANMVAVNPASWLTNFVPLTQGWAALDSKHLMNGMRDTLKAYKADDGMVDMSTFLTNRRGSDPLVRTWQQGASAALSKPMDWIDNFTSDTLIRARYRQNLDRGFSESESISEADSWAAGVMADRSKGSMPMLFEQRNPFTKLFTQFQLEVNNQLSYVFKDVPREMKDKGVAALAVALLKFALGAWLYDELYEYIIGRRPALDPIGILNDTVGDATGYEIPNLIELGVGAVSGDLPSFRTEKKGGYETATNLMGSVAEELPFIGGLMGGGRLPINSAIPSVDNLGKAMFNDEWSPKKRIATAAKELGKPATYLVPPFGGGQLKKIYDGLKATIKKGSYTLDAEGNEQLQYPVYADNWWQGAYSFAKAATFGKTSLKPGRDWVEGGFGNFTAEQTACYKAMMEAGVSGEDSFGLVKSLREAEKTEERSKDWVMRDILQQSKISGEGKAVAYYGLLADDKERALMEELDDTDIKPEQTVNLLIDMKNASKVTGTDGAVDQSRKAVQREILRKSDVSGEAKKLIYRTMLAEESDNKILDELGDYSDNVIDTIMDIKDAEGTANKLHIIADQPLNDREALALAGMVMGSELKTKKGKSTQYANMLSASKQGISTDDALRMQADGIDLGDFVELREFGVEAKDAQKYLEAVGDLEPMEGKKQVAEVQKWRTAIDTAVTTTGQLNLLSTVMDEKTYAKVKVGYDLGLEPAAYVRVKEVLPQFDENGNGSYSSAEITAAINSISTSGLMLPGGDHTVFSLTSEQQGILWQMFSTSKTAKNNPFNSAAGKRYLEAKGGGV